MIRLKTLQPKGFDDEYAYEGAQLTDKQIEKMIELRNTHKFIDEYAYEGAKLEDKQIKNMIKLKTLQPKGFDDYYAYEGAKLEETQINKQAGITTIDYVKLFKEDIHGKDGRTMPYNKMGGGSGCAMRTICIGMAYFGDENRDKLIEVAIETSRLTHNSPIGYLGGLVIALFAAYAIEGININQWPFLMMEVLKSDKIISYLKIKEEKYDYEIFVKFWRRYLDTRFKNNQPIKSKVNTNLLYRTYYYNSKLIRDDDDEFKNEVAGSSGFSAGIVAYDCLIDAEDKWEKLVIYSMLHVGDSDTTGCIAAGLYGLLYGFGDVPESNMKYLELKEQSEEIGKLLYKKYYLRENIK